jgi:hypothetical protein
VSCWKHGRSWPEVFDTSRIVVRAGVRIGKNGENVRPIHPEDLPQVRVPVDLLRSMIFMKVLTPSPRVNIGSSRDRGDNSIEGVRAEPVRVVQEHDELEDSFFVIGEIDKGSVPYLPCNVGGVDAVVSACVIDVRAEELGVSSPTVIDVAEKFEGPP